MIALCFLLSVADRVSFFAVIFSIYSACNFAFSIIGFGVVFISQAHPVFWHTETKRFKEPVDWVIWPESSLGINGENNNLKSHLSQLAKDKSIHLSAGGSSRVLIPQENTINSEIFSYNSVFNYAPDGKYLGRYDKQILVPFSEFTPFVKQLGISNIKSGFTAGTESKTYKIKLATVAFPICYEAIFQSIFKEYSNVDLIANVSNDIWFTDSWGRELHAMISQLRSIEFGIPIIRTGYTGVSFYVKPNGKRLFELPNNKKSIQKIAIPYGSIPTFYAKWGDWFVFVCLLIILFGFIQVSNKIPKSINHNDKGI